MNAGPLLINLLINLLVTAVAVAATMLATMAYALRTKTQSVVDTVWGLGFVVIAVVSFTASAVAGEGLTARRAILLVLTTVWGLRLGAYIHTRNRGQGEDPRYAALMRRNTGPVAPYVLRTIYWPQGAIMWVVSLPVQVAMYENTGLGVLTWAGIVVWTVGFLFESVGDRQLARFKADPAKAGKVMDRGLWAWTRHPNYFGDATVWWGLFLVACSHWAGLLTVVGPVLMTHMLVSRSGKALLERRMGRRRGPEYADYLARTSGFLPWPPKRRQAAAQVPEN
jgi:steroid 5-alpha reductase family enzyme